MHRIACPYCGTRDEAEFDYRGDAGVSRPSPTAGIDAFHDFVYTRENPKGWAVEWWHHVAGCRRWLKVVRHTVTHEIVAVLPATATPLVPVNDVLATPPTNGAPAVPARETPNP